jgi:DNA mismatch endonuclease, patch repair protein
VADIFSTKKRSKIMASVQGTETKPEITVRKFLFSKGLRYRKNSKILPGKPDIVLAKHKTVIFVNGCFWHGHKNCEASTLPKSKVEYWSKKIGSNIERDKRNIRALKRMGWKVIVVWECQIKKMIKESNSKLISSILKPSIHSDKKTRRGGITIAM